LAEFAAEVLDAAEREREVGLTTYGRRTGAAHRNVVWVTTDGRRLFVRSGGGPGRHWTRNLFARPDGVLHIGGTDVPVRARHFGDPAPARAVSRLVAAKYGVQPPAAGASPTPAELATFELLPA
jgi:hypothetical protein